MKSAELEKLKRRARRCGVQTEFIDTSGQRRQSSPETLHAMIDLVSGETDVSQPVPPVIVCWDGKPKAVAVEPPIVFRSATASLLPLPEGHGQGEGEQSVAISTRENSSVILHIPKLSPGYHELRIELDGRTHRSLVISAPVRAFAQRAMRDWGVFVPMYAVRSASSWGAGNLSDWERLCESLPDRSVVATLPLLGAFLEEWKCEPSPYSPATRLFWNEFYLDVTRTPEFAASAAAKRFADSSAFRREVSALRKNGLVDYLREMQLKRRLLERVANKFFCNESPRRQQFEAFVKEHSELKRYAAFRAVCQQRREAWQTWPYRMRGGHFQSGDYDEGTARYFMFAQWLAQEQISQVLSACRQRSMKFYLDLPLGVNPDGYDVWANQHLFENHANVGAPPDAFFTKGQDWGFPPLHPQRIRGAGYRYVIDYLRFQMRHTGLLRLDHVMGLHRLWWIPRGASASDGAYVSYNAEELYAILCLESHRHQTMLVGENLGTVPPEVNRSMKRHGLRTMYVVQYEAQPDAKQTLRKPPRDCVASINTHDMPMWAAHWKGLDIGDRQRLGLLKPKEARDERKRRAKLRVALTTFLRRRKLVSGHATAQSVLGALLKFLSRSEAELVLVNLEDLWLETQPQNTPGTSTERVNWRRKARRSIEELVASGKLAVLERDLNYDEEMRS